VDVGASKESAPVRGVIVRFVKENGPCTVPNGVVGPINSWIT